MRICEGFFSGVKKEWMIPLFTFYIIVELKKKVSSDSGIQGNRNLQSS